MGRRHRKAPHQGSGEAVIVYALGSLADDILSMVHAFSDAERRQGVRDLAKRADALRSQLRASEAECERLRREVESAERVIKAAKNARGRGVPGNDRVYLFDQQLEKHERASRAAVEYLEKESKDG